MTERNDATSPRHCQATIWPRSPPSKAGSHNPMLPPPKTAGVYVDIENLGDAQHARAVIESVIRDWPDGLPSVRRLSLYAPADKTGLWGAWAPTRFPDLDVRVRGVQRFGRETSKNSADLAFVADAIGDFTTGAANHIAVVSNDSDFDALFVKLQELASEAGNATHPPFLWINLPGGSGLSKEIEDGEGGNTAMGMDEDVKAAFDGGEAVLARHALPGTLRAACHGGGVEFAVAGVSESGDVGTAHSRTVLSVPGGTSSRSPRHSAGSRQCGRCRPSS